MAMRAAAFWARRHGFALGFGACLLCSVAPLFATRVLPFHDAAGMIGLGGALAHTSLPAARIAEFFAIDIGAYPSALYFGWALCAAALGVPMDIAFSVFLGLFGLMGPPLALLAVLRAFARPRAIALLAFPFVWHHQIWFGFLGSAASVTFVLLVLAGARNVVIRRRVRDHLGFALALLVLASAHPFALVLGLAVVAPVLVWPAPDRAQMGWAARARRWGLRLACFAPALAFLARWAVRFSSTGDGIGLFTHIKRELSFAHPPLSYELSQLFLWLGNGYVSGADELVPAVGLVVLAAFLVLGVRDDHGDGRAGAGPGWVWLLWAALVLAVGFFVLPVKVSWPTPWWGLRARCVAPLIFVVVAAVRPARRGLPAWAAAPALAVALGFFAFVTYDLRTFWQGGVLPGFDQAINAIPPGRSVLALPAEVPWDFHPTHYSEGHPYLVQHYVGRKGGRAVPYLVGHPGSYWVTQKPPPPAPPWGDAAQFDFAEHAAGYDYFLVELPLDEQPTRVDPLERAPVGAVRLVSAQGRWRLYERQR